MGSRERERSKKGQLDADRSMIKSIGVINWLNSCSVYNDGPPTDLTQKKIPCLS